MALQGLTEHVARKMTGLVKQLSVQAVVFVDNDCLSSRAQRTSLILMHLWHCQPREIDVLHFKIEMYLSAFIVCLFLLCGALPNLSVESCNLNYQRLTYMKKCVHIYKYRMYLSVYSITITGNLLTLQLLLCQLDLGEAGVRGWLLCIPCIRQLQTVCSQYLNWSWVTQSRVIRNCCPAWANHRDFVPSTALPLARLPLLCGLCPGAVVINLCFLQGSECYINMKQLSPIMLT